MGRLSFEALPIILITLVTDFVCKLSAGHWANFSQIFQKKGGCHSFDPPRRRCPSVVWKLAAISAKQMLPRCGREAGFK
jgi:hypothetical protein